MSAFEISIVWLQWGQGYFCIKGFPGDTTGSGGRDEIDLVAVKFNNNKVDEIVWVEATEYLSAGEKTVLKKFTAEKEQFVRKYLKELYGIGQNKKIIKKFYVAHEHPRLKEIPNLVAEIITGKEIIDECRDAVAAFTNSYNKITRGRNKKPTIPNECEYIKMFEKLIFRKKNILLEEI